MKRRSPNTPHKLGAGAHFTPGYWRPDRPTGAVAIPEGPRAPIVRPEFEDAPNGGGRVRDPQTAANIAAHEAVLRPRRWTPPDRNGR